MKWKNKNFVSCLNYSPSNNPPLLPLLRIVWLLLEYARVKIIISLVERENLSKLKFRQFLCVSVRTANSLFFVCPEAFEEKFARCRVPYILLPSEKLLFHTEIMNNIHHRFVLIRKLLLIATL